VPARAPRLNERAAGALDRLPREHKDEWLGTATRSLGKARSAYTAAINELAGARDQLGDDATLVSFLHNYGMFTQAFDGLDSWPPERGG
jgi:hypothetical protein